MPDDIVDYEIDRVPGETDEEFEAARRTYDRLSRAAAGQPSQIRRAHTFLFVERKRP